jgi:hypothetical protein
VEKIADHRKFGPQSLQIGKVRINADLGPASAFNEKLQILERFLGEIIRPNAIVIASAPKDRDRRQNAGSERRQMVILGTQAFSFVDGLVRDIWKRWAVRVGARS